VFVFKVLLLGEDGPRISEQETSFLDMKGTLEHLDNYIVIIIFSSTEKPDVLPCHIMDKMFVAEVARQYNYWLHLLQKKRKKKVHSSALESRGVCVEKRQQN
jgi:hypothetical protein